MPRGVAEVLSALREVLEEEAARRRRMRDPVQRAVLSRRTLLVDEGLYVPRVLDLLAAIEGPAVPRDLGALVEDAHRVERSEHDDRLADELVRDRVVVLVEAHIGRLPDRDLAPLVHHRQVRRGRAEERTLPLERLADRDRRVFRPGPHHRVLPAPLVRLRVQVVHVAPVAGHEEPGPRVADRTLDPRLLVRPRRRHGARFVAPRGRVLEEHGVEPDRLAEPLDHDGLRVVVQHDLGAAAPRREGRLVAAEEVLDALAEEEPHEDRARIREHDHEREELTDGPPDLDVAEVGPVGLCLLAGEGLEAEEGLDGPFRPEVHDDVTEVLRRAHVAALAAHGEEAARRELRVAPPRLLYEPEEGVDAARPRGRVQERDARLLRHALDDGVVHLELARDRPRRPQLGDQTQDLGFDLARDHETPPASAAAR